jgi:hypothetical protein
MFPAIIIKNLINKERIWVIIKEKIYKLIKCNNKFKNKMLILAQYVGMI